MSKKESFTKKSSEHGSSGAKSKTATPGLHYLFALVICLAATGATLPIKFAGEKDAQTTFWVVFVTCVILETAVLFTWLRDGHRGYKGSSKVTQSQTP